MTTDSSDPTELPISGVNHIALMTRDLDRLANFYEVVFDAEILARSDGRPRKCFAKLTSTTNLHMFEVESVDARGPGDDAFDPGSINHFALEARSPEAFVTTRAKLVQAGRADEAVYETPDLCTSFATDPDGLFIELILRKPANWTPPFPTERFVGIGQSS